MRQIKLKEVEKHDSSRSLWMIIHNEVYDVTKFVDEHPGGAESLLDFAGKDGTEAFEDVGHSQDARELLKKYKIGVLPRDEQKLAPCEAVTEFNKDCIVYPCSCCGSDEPDDNKTKNSAKSSNSGRGLNESQGNNSKNAWTPSNSTCVGCEANEDIKPKKTWRTFDGSPEKHHRRRPTPKPHKCDLDGPPRTRRIDVPRERLPCGMPPSGTPDSGGSSKLKWALIALAGAIIIGIALNKYAVKS